MVDQYSDRFNDLLKRRPTEDYIRDWTTAIKLEAETKEEGSLALSYIVFRLGEEWLAIKTKFLIGVLAQKPVHKLPHQKDILITGITNIEGGLVLCVNLRDLLDIKPSIKEKTGLMGYDRMIALTKDNFQCLFPVDEVRGIFSLYEKNFQNVPLTLTSSTANFLKAICLMDGQSIGLLDDELIFSRLKRGCL
ncbi:MAG: chemotaxis protein CheW [Parachlamydia sp.]|nr:chemotaxis protein CheW [Parachlamydia sp.]